MQVAFNKQMKLSRHITFIHIYIIIYTWTWMGGRLVDCTTTQTFRYPCVCVCVSTASLMYLDWASRKISPQKVCQSDIVSRGFVGYRPANEMHLMSCADWEGKVDIILGLNGDVFRLSTPHNSLLINRWRCRHRDPLHHQAHDDNDCFPQRRSIFRTEDQHPPTATHRDVRDTSGINTHTSVLSNDPLSCRFI